jgi:rhamnose transport system ATP-binding protein
VRALKGVSFDLRRGEVHALIGENGAGKSTLIKIITGAETADSGTLAVDGQPVRRMDPHLAQTFGIAAIYQQPALFPHLTVAENIALPLESGHGWRAVDWKARRRKAADVLSRIGASIDPERLADTLSMPEQQVVEIAKAIGSDARILVMDEPTASLSEREVARLFEVIALVRGHGVGVIYISHRLEEVSAIADRITVLRDGESVTTLASAGGPRDESEAAPAAGVGVGPHAARGLTAAARSSFDRANLIRLMVGRELATVFPKRPVSLGEVALELRRVSHRATGVRDVSLSVRSGEILGLAGLVGSGRTELAEIVFGLVRADEGEILLRGAPVRISSPADAIALGIGYLPEDRRQHGVILEMSVAANTTLANLDAVSRGGLISRRIERDTAEQYVERFRIKTPSVGADVESLSGGNQQKVALARWLAIKPSVLILDEPTQGVDVGAKAEIHGLMQQLVELGLAIIMISSELPEILGMSDRIAVMRTGYLSGVLAREDATQDNILALALGDDAGRHLSRSPM